MKNRIVDPKGFVGIFAMVLLVFKVSSVSWGAIRLERPVPGVEGVDWAISFYVDLDRDRGKIRDYRGGTKTYDGHAGVDFFVPNFGWTDNNFPVIAAAGGRVTALHDQEFDRHSLKRFSDLDFNSCGMWNFVEVTHSDGSRAIYGHLKKNSVVVSVGQHVTPGQKLGVIASSGCSSGPHLHLEIRTARGRVVDPFLEGLWIDPPRYNPPLMLRSEPPVLPPDLIVLSPQASKTELAPGERFTLSATVRNQGHGDSPATTLRGYRASDDTPETEVGRETISAIAGAGSSNARIQLTAPDAPGTYTYHACVEGAPGESNTNNNCSPAVSITVAMPPEVLVISAGNDQNGTSTFELTDPIAVLVLDADDNGVANVGVTFRIAKGQGRFSSHGPRRTVTVNTNSRGFAEVSFTPTSVGTLIVRASVRGLDPVAFTVNARPPPAELVKVSGDTQRGSPSLALAEPFVVEVQDADNNPVAGVPVRFSVTAGGGKLSAATVKTGANGRAQTVLTLGSKRAVNSVSASVSGIDAPVIFSTSIDPIVLVAASKRPPLYWVDMQAGTLHRLVDDNVENLVPTVQNATSLAVDMTGGRLYWTEQTSKRAGRIRHANLDGTDVALVKELTSIPYHLAVDTTVGKLYLTNSWGKVQRLNVDGSNFEPNLITGLDNLKDMVIDVAGSKVYWIKQLSERSGEIWHANLDGTNVQLVRNLTSVPYSLAIDALKGKLYLTNSWGKVQRLNVDGSNFEPNLITDLDAPHEVAVDTTGSYIYWTDGGILRRALLDGGNIESVVTDLGILVSLALGSVPAVESSAAAPARVSGLPNETALHPNYPNPFNPETWIPYQLSESADVTLTIYAVNGHVVRQLALGHQPAGMYQSRSRAAYWDGRNALDEPVASGVYFYTLEAGNFTSTRKMLIMK